MSPAVPRSRRALVVGGIAAAVTVSGAGFAYAATTASTTATPSSSASSANTHAGTATKNKHPRAEELVTAVTANSITVDTPSGSKTFALSSTTTYHRGQATATAKDIQVSEMVRIRAAKKSGTPTAQAVTIAPAVLTGYVQSLGGGTLTVIDESGFTRNVTTSGGTTYRKNGAPGSSSDVSVGSLVHVQGTIAGDGTSIAATAVGVRSR